MNNGVIGLILGAILGVINYVVLKKVAERTEMPESKRLLGILGLLDLALLPAIGYVVGAYVLA